MDKYLKKFTDRINGVEIGVGKTQAPKATLDGFTSDDGTWNSVVKDEMSGKSYRERVETLIFSGNTVYLAFKPDGSYKIPGGGTEPGVPMEQSAIKECKEEAFIIPKNLAFVDTFAEECDKGNKNYNGRITNLFVGEFGSEYTGTVHDVDLDPFIRENGRFYEIEEVYYKLSPFHQKGIDKWRENRLATESVYFYEMTAKERNALPDSEFGIPSRRAFPLNDAQHVKSAITMFRHCPNSERAELAKRIFAKYRKFNLDVKISKKNPLWKYAKDETGIVTEGVEFVPDGSTRLDKYTQIVMSVEAISRYSTICPKLTELKFGPEYSGYIWLDGSAVVGFVHVTRISGEKWLTALEVEPEYENLGLEMQMAKEAAKTLGATRSRINKEGVISRLAMEELGFEPSHPDLPVDNSYEDYDVPTNKFESTEDILSKLDAQWEMMLEAPGDDEPTDYTADIEDDPDADEDDLDLDADLAELDDDFDNLSGENDDLDEDPVDYTDDMDSPADDDDDIEGDSTDYTADMDDEPVDDPAEAEAPEEAPAAEDAPVDDTTDAEPTQEAPGDDPAPADDTGTDAPPADDAGGEDAPADEPAEGEGEGDAAAGGDDADMGEPTDYTDDTGEDADPDAEGDTGGDDTGGDEGGGDAGGDEMPEEEIEDKRQSLEIYRNLQSLYDALDGYIARLDTVPISTTNSSIVVQSVKAKFDEIRDLLNDYMVTKFANDSIVEQSDAYTKFIVSTKMVIDLLKNNQVYLKQ